MYYFRLAMRKSPIAKLTAQENPKPDQSMIDRMLGMGGSQLPVKRNGMYCKRAVKEKILNPTIRAMRLG